MRVVERRPRSGVYLRAESQVGSLDAIVMKADLGLPFDLRESDHLSEFRSILETQAIELACVRRTQEDIDRLDACMSACRERFGRGESIAQPSADFHLAVVRRPQPVPLARRIVLPGHARVARGGVHRSGGLPPLDPDHRSYGTRS
jgi:DNA-binding FadR family transcriptional regulator